MKNFLGKRSCLPAAIAALIAGCGGGGSDTSPTAPVQTPGAASITVGADVKSVDWNIPSTIDVTANDSASRGTVTLSAVAGAEHGSAALADGKIVYTPAAGFYGVEKLVYTVTGEGGASAKGEAVVTVEAVMTLNGNASDDPLAGASVTARIGERSFVAPANANGDFSLVLRSSSPTDFITLVASGTGAQAQVKLASLVGDVAGLAKHATAQGQVGMAQAPALGVTHITTAFMALATKSQGGSAPASAQQLADAAKKVDVVDVMRVATAIKLSADKGVALPAGVSDTMALAASETAIGAVYVTAGPVLAAETRTVVENQTSAPAGAFSLGGLAERTVVYRSFTVTYRADGTGHMSGRMGERDITWAADGPTVRLTYASPWNFEYEANTMKVNGVTSPYSFREISTGMVIQSVLNDATAKWGETGTVTYTSGPDTGKPVVGSNVTTTNAPSTLSTAFNLDQRLPITPAMTAVGATMAGIYANAQPTLDTTSVPGSAFVAVVPRAYDVLEFTGAAEARFQDSGKTVSWSVSDNYLVIQDNTAGSVVWKMALVGNNSNGQQQWVGISNNLLVPFLVEPGDMAKPRFTDELIMRNWTANSYLPLRGQPQSDHSMTSTTYPSPTYSGTWEITAAGDLMVRYVRTSTNSSTYARRYIPVRWVGKKLIVFMTGSTVSSFATFEEAN